jgi:hypothetical protein
MRVYNHAMHRGSMSACHSVITTRHWKRGWNGRTAFFVLEFEDAIECDSTASEIFLPEIHFPCGAIKVEVSDGEWTFDCVSRMLTFRHIPSGAGHRLVVKRGVL